VATRHKHPQAAAGAAALECSCSCSSSGSCILEQQQQLAGRVLVRGSQVLVWAVSFLSHIAAMAVLSKGLVAVCVQQCSIATCVARRCMSGLCGGLAQSLIWCNRP
jgi:hypothetical protein